MMCLIKLYVMRAFFTSSETNIDTFIAISIFRRCCEMMKMHAQCKLSTQCEILLLSCIIKM